MKYSTRRFCDPVLFVLSFTLLDRDSDNTFPGQLSISMRKSLTTPILLLKECTGASWTDRIVLPGRGPTIDVKPANNSPVEQMW